MATNGRTLYFPIQENASSQQIYALLGDVESADEDEHKQFNEWFWHWVHSWRRNSQAAGTKDTSLITPEANLHVVPNDNQSKKKEKKKKEEFKQEECHLVPARQPNLNETVFPIEIFPLVTGLKELLELIVEQSNFYAHQNGRNFTVSKEERKAFLGINFIIWTNKLPRIAEYWRVDNLIGNDGIQNTMIWNRFCEIFQNLHFADNKKDDKADKAFKMRPEIDHLNLKFSKTDLEWSNA